MRKLGKLVNKVVKWNCLSFMLMVVFGIGKIIYGR